MSHSGEVLLDWDKTADILYVVREGYDLNSLVNVNSDKAPGFVKRIDPKSRQCVGFMVHSFSVRFASHTNCDEGLLRSLMDASLRLTNEAAHTKEEIRKVAELLVAA